jgi:hypothetical protein
MKTSVLSKRRFERTRASFSRFGHRPGNLHHHVDDFDITRNPALAGFELVAIEVHADGLVAAAARLGGEAIELALDPATRGPDSARFGFGVREGVARAERDQTLDEALDAGVGNISERTAHLGRRRGLRHRRRRLSRRVRHDLNHGACEHRRAETVSVVEHVFTIPVRSAASKPR